jgi:hypothetical protein
MTAMSALVDDFSVNDLASLWSGSGGGTSIAYCQAVLPCTTGYSQLTSSSAYNLTGSYAYALIAPFLGGATYQTYLEVTLDASNNAGIGSDGTSLIAYLKQGGATVTLATISYNPTNHAWLRIREAAGTLYFEAAPDGTTWTVIASSAYTMSLAAVFATVYSGHASGPDGHAYVRWFNTQPRESLTVNGQSLLPCAQAFTPDLSGLLSAPLVRTADITVPGKHGLVKVTRKLYDRAQVPLQIWVRGMNADGTYPADSARDSLFYQNLDVLMQMFAVSGTVQLVHAMPSGGVRVITGQVLQAIAPARFAWTAGRVGALGVIIECADPFWREPFLSSHIITSTASPTTTPLSGFAGCTAPIEDAVIKFSGPCSNPVLTSGNWSLQYSDTFTGGQSVTIDCGAWTITTSGPTADYSKLVHAGIGPWFSVDPVPGGPSATYSHGGTSLSACTITGERAFLGG